MLFYVPVMMDGITRCAHDFVLVNCHELSSLTSDHSVWAGATSIRTKCRPNGTYRTGPPYSVGRWTAHAPGRRRAEHPRARRPAGRPASRQRYRRRRQTTAYQTILAY